MRNEWTFQYSIQALLEAAVAKHAYHKDRMEWWVNKKSDVVASIKGEGIEIDDSLAADSPKFASSNYGRGATAMIRDDLLRDLTECVGKVKEHHLKVKEYDGWVQVLGDQPGIAFREIDHGDWLFFFSKR